MPEPVTAKLLTGFDDSACCDAIWSALLEQSDTNVVYLTKPWLRAWWEHLGEGKLLLIAAERRGEVVALAPLYATEGMVFFLGAGESDYLDFLGAAHEPPVLAALLRTAREHAPDFVGLRLHLLPDRSRTAAALTAASEEAQLDVVEEAVLPSVEIDLCGKPTEVRAALEGEMLRRETYCRKHGELEIHHLTDLDEIRAQLPEFYAQHIARWRVKEIDSQYTERRQRAFLERFLELAADSGWIRFLRVDWNGSPIAFEFAWYYRNVFYPGPWSFAVEYAKQSPGQILLRQSILAALEQGLATYDLGGGDQDYKLRLPATLFDCRSWGLYPF